MKIDYAIMSSDSNPLYLDFWPLVSKVWKIKFNITPILLYIDNIDLNIDTTYGTVVKIKPVENYPIYIQNLFVRYWYTINFPDKISIISDVDMFPISKFYFESQLSSISDTKYVHINPCVETYNFIPSCYHIASGLMYKKVLNLDECFERTLKGIDKYKNTMLPGKEFWFSDELYATENIQNYKNKEDFVFIKRDGGQNGHRIDRNEWGYDESLFASDYYYDSHSIRPFQHHSDAINKLAGLILKA